jgi:hypothetical protein
MTAIEQSAIYQTVVAFVRLITQNWSMSPRIRHTQPTIPPDSTVARSRVHSSLKGDTDTGAGTILDRGGYAFYREFGFESGEMTDDLRR